MSTFRSKSHIHSPVGVGSRQQLPGCNRKTTTLTQPARSLVAPSHPPQRRPGLTFCLAGPLALLPLDFCLPAMVLSNWLLSMTTNLRAAFVRTEGGQRRYACALILATEACGWRRVGMSTTLGTSMHYCKAWHSGSQLGAPRCPQVGMAVRRERSDASHKPALRCLLAKPLGTATAESIMHGWCMVLIKRRRRRTGGAGGVPGAMEGFIALTPSSLWRCTNAAAHAPAVARAAVV